MEKVYIDCGSHNGDSVLEFLENGSIFIKRPDTADYKIYAIEPNADFYNLNNKFKDKNVQIIEAAAWVYDGEIEFKNAAESLSSCVSKYTMQCFDEAFSERKIFPCFDLSQFILNLSANYIVLKMDVESAEYDLIPKLIETKAISRINEIYVEFHHPGNQEYEKIKVNVMDYINVNHPSLKFFDNWP